MIECSYILQHDTVLVNVCNNNQYIVIKALDWDGFGIVYAAWDVKNRKQVAIKEYFPNIIVDRLRDFHTVAVIDANDEFFFYRQKELFFKDAQNMQRLNTHRNIVNVTDYFEANGTAYVVMEFIDGQTFVQVLKNTPDGRMSLQSVLANLKPVFDALDCLHNASRLDDENKCHRGFVHGSIDPHMIIFPDNGSVKLLIDFGADFNVRMNMMRYADLPLPVFLGYVPLEQHYSSNKYRCAQGPWTDVYALAATIYRAIVGTTPPGSLQREQNGEPLPLPSAMGIDITPQQEKALLKGLALDYRKRYQTVRDFYNALYASEPSYHSLKYIQTLRNFFIPK